MSSKWLWGLALVAAAVTVIAAVIIGATLMRYQADDPAQQEVPSEEVYRVIGVWDGQVAVFLPQTDSPETVYDVRVASLPEEEQQKLIDGIEVESLETLKRRLEDYLS